jgi:uncharacterized protein
MKLSRRHGSLEPMRTCVGCRQVVPQSALVRVVCEDGRAILDEARRHIGRGAWVHRSRTCVSHATRGGLARSFKRAVDGTALIDWAGREFTLHGDLREGERALASASEKS